MEKINSVSIIILAKNEESGIRDLIQTFHWAGEVIVVDNDSTDTTQKEATNAGAKVISAGGTDFSKLRSIGAKEAKGPWLLYIDTDEVVTEELKKEIISILSTSDKEIDIPAYTIKRKNYYLGKQWPFSDGMIRFIYKPRLKGWFGALHETASIDGRTGELTHKLIHNTHTSFEDMVRKTNEWSNIEAKLRLDANHPKIAAWRICRVFCTGFSNSFIHQKGFQVGTIGILESLYQGFSLAITYCKLWELQKV
jgi:glycosyltransferase involved in cell wall biosynthesis